jgi:peptidoglycan biosynthesis protein MviN/MurJ (putative lipid II flippase)
MGVISTAVYVALNLVLMRPMGANGLALSMSVAAAINLVGLLLLLQRRLGDARLAQIGAAFLRVTGASGVAAVVGWLGARCVTAAGVGLTASEAAAQLAIGGGSAAVVYCALAVWLRVPEALRLWEWVRRERPREPIKRPTV